MQNALLYFFSLNQFSLNCNLTFCELSSRAKIVNMYSNTTTSIISTSFIILPSVIFLLLLCTPTKVLSKEEIVDTSYPIVIEDRFEVNKSQSEFTKTYFGYSVSLAQGKTTPNHPLGWIFIGAPKSNSSRSAKYSDKDNEPGVMWRCSLGRSSPDLDFCQMMNIDPPLKVKGKTPKVGNPRSEDFNGAFIGVTSEINHNLFVSCGMRWKRGGNQFYNGICYWFADVDNFGKTSYRTNDLTKLVNPNLLDQRLMPFFIQDKETERVFSFMTRKKVIENGHEWQLGQAGMSIHLFLDADGSSTSPNLLIGAPGVRQWAGAVVLYTNTKTAGKGLGDRLNRNMNDSTFSEFIVLNRGLIPKEDDKINHFLWDEYFGYSVSSGKYLQKDKVLYAAGAPRANHCGTVVIFDAPPYEEPNSTYKRQIRSYINITAPDHSFGSYFGSVLYSVDYNEDGLDELFVGAPLYTFPNSREIGDQGCVFVYQFNSIEGGLAVNPVQELVGSKSPRARFGSAITSLKMNSYDNKLVQPKIYLVIGAPFELAENDYQAVGAIYLYLYNQEAGKFDALFAQRIHASRISESLNGFGSSLSIPQDIDMNKTPDLAIGAFKSGHAVVLRTRPRIILRSWMKFVTPEKSEIATIRRGTKEFHLKSCFSVKEILGLVANTVVIWTKLEFSDRSIQFSGTHVNETEGNTPNKLVFFRQVNAHRSETCEDIIIVSRHKDGVGMDDFDKVRERMDPFTFFQEVWYNETLHHPVSVLKFYAKTPSTPQPQNSTFSSFNSNLPNPQKVTSAASVEVSISDCKDICQPNLEMTWSFSLPWSQNQSISSFTIGESSEVIMHLNILNTGETAEKPKITFHWAIMSITESLSGYRWLYSHGCKNASDSSLTIYESCNLRQYIIKGHNVPIQIRFNLNNFYAADPANFKFVVHAQVNFNDKHIKPFRDYGELPLVVPKTEVSIHGSKLSENEILRGLTNYYVTKLPNALDENENVIQDMLYASFRQRFAVLLQGASVNEIVANFKIPVSWKGKQIFFVKQPHEQSENIECLPLPSSKFSFHKIGVTAPNSSVSIPGEGITIVSNTEALQDHSMIEQHVNPVRRRREINSWEMNATDANQTEINENDEQLENMENMTLVVESFAKQVKLMPPEDALKFKCTLETDCLQVRCMLKNVKANRPIYIPFEMFPIRESVDNLLKSSRKSVMYIEATGSVDIFPKSPNRQTYHDKDTAEVILEKKIPGKVQMWVYIAAAGSGFCLLFCIVLALCKCGFFKRNKRHELNHLRAELNRKSKMVPTRSSMMAAQSTAGAGIKKGDAIGEHPNGDTVVVKCGKSTDFPSVSYKELQLEEKKCL